MKLISDCDANQAKRIFEILAEDSDIFEGFSSKEIEDFSGVFKLLTFKK